MTKEANYIELYCILKLISDITLKFAIDNCCLTFSI